MTIDKTIKLYQRAVVQIATPYSTGTGFYLPRYNLFVTNEHVVRDNKEVVVLGEKLEKQLASVVYLDQDYDLAFLKIEAAIKVDSRVKLIKDQSISLGAEVISIGHPFGMKFSVSKGIISSIDYKVSQTNYLQHDAAMHPGNSGGPLINNEGEIMGVNTFISREGRNIGFALPSEKLEAALQSYTIGEGKKATKCTACKTIVFEDKNINYCKHCGAGVISINSIREYEPHGVNKTLEQMISDMGYNVKLSLSGPKCWSLDKGSARINIIYHEKSGLITGDAHLCKLPDTDILNLYQYLLEENYLLDGLTFSVKENDIILSLLIYDQYFNMNTARTLFDKLFALSDHYDNILVEKYGCHWNNEN